jgi:hypothetical protein
MIDRIIFAIHRFLTKSNRMTTVNEKTYSGKKVNLMNGKVIIDGIDCTPPDSVISITVSGNVETLTVERANQILVQGTVGELNSGSGDIECSDILGSCKTGSGNITCKSIAQGATTGSGDISANSITGNLKTGSGDIIYNR